MCCVKSTAGHKHYILLYGQWQQRGGIQAVLQACPKEHAAFGLKQGQTLAKVLPQRRNHEAGAFAIGGGNVRQMDLIAARIQIMGSHCL